MEGVVEDAAPPYALLGQGDGSSEAALTSVAANFETDVSGTQGLGNLVPGEKSVRLGLKKTGSRGVQGGLYYNGEGITAGPLAENLLGKNLNINADQRLMTELGRERWLDIALNGPVGVVEGVQVGGEAVHRCTLKEGRNQCVCLYTEREYKDLIIEAHYDYRFHFYHPDKRRWYWCRFCHQIFSDKNSLSWHRHTDQCQAWKDMQSGPVRILKMYPTFCPSDGKIYTKILKEAGLVFPAPEGHRPWAPKTSTTLYQETTRKEAVRLDVEAGHEYGAVGGAENMVIDIASGAGSVCRLLQEPNTPISQITPGSEEATQDIEESHALPGLECQTFSDDQPRPSSFKRLRRFASDKTAKIVEKTNAGQSSSTSRYALRSRDIHIHQSAKEVSKPLELSEDEDTTPMPPRRRVLNEGCTAIQGSSSATQSTREEVLAAAQKQAERLTMKDVPEIGSPPPVMKVPGLYYILKESPEAIIQKDLLDIPERCIAKLNEMEVNGELGHRLMAATGPWIYWRRAHTVSLFPIYHCVLVDLSVHFQLENLLCRM